MESTLRYDGTIDLRTSHGSLHLLLCVSHQFAARYFLQQVASAKYRGATVLSLVPGFYLQFHQSDLTQTTTDLGSEMDLEDYMVTDGAPDLKTSDGTLTKAQSSDEMIADSQTLCHPSPLSRVEPDAAIW